MDELMGQVADALEGFASVLLRFHLEQDGWTAEKVTALRNRVMCGEEFDEVGFLERLRSELAWLSRAEEVGR